LRGNAEETETRTDAISSKTWGGEEKAPGLRVVGPYYESWRDREMELKFPGGEVVEGG